MEKTHLSSPSMRELFVRQLGGMILTGQLKTGDALPSERELCERLGVSRAVVNGGLSELAREGFVEVSPRKGTFVADRRRGGSLNTLSAELRLSGKGLRDDDLRSVCELIHILTRLALSEAIGQSADDPSLGELGDALNALTYAPPSDSASAAFNFAHTLALMGKNTVLPLLYRSLQPLFIEAVRAYCERRGSWDEPARAAETLYACMADRDLEAAERWVDVCFSEMLREFNASDASD